MSDFNDRPFVAGSLTGLRAFSVDKLGRLDSPSYSSIFRPGENVAACRKSEAASSWGGMFMPSRFYHYDYTFSPVPTSSFRARLLGFDPPREEPESKPEPLGLVKAFEDEKRKTHRPGEADCTCGYYAYFDGTNEYKDRTRITAVVEGYGLCTVGDRGFRAEKMRLLALVKPKAAVPPLLWSLVQRNYPDVPTFARKRDALEIYPLTTPEVPGLDAEDFWTRSAR